MYIPNLVIEVTRRCQLECEHCLRGDAQSIDIDRNHIYELLTNYNIDSIGTITFTGGEPFLNIEAIAYTISILKTNKIEVSDFYIATNGMVFEHNNEYAKACMSTIMDLWFLCHDNEISCVDISSTPFHYNDITADNLLNVFSFVGRKGEGLNTNHLISQGRGEHTSTAANPITRDNEFQDEYPEDLMVYLNARGLLVWNCDLSYDYQDAAGVSIYYGMGMVQDLLEKEVA